MSDVEDLSDTSVQSQVDACRDDVEILMSDAEDLSDASEQSQESSDDFSDDDDVGRAADDIELRNELAQWAVNNQITTNALRELLNILGKHHNLPKDPRTLRATGCVSNVKEIQGGSYYHFGLSEGIKAELAQHPELQDLDTISIHINIDGLPLFKSTQAQFWPILGLVKDTHSEPFVIGLFCGHEKPKNVHEFLHDFVQEVVRLQETGIDHNGKVYGVRIKGIICDAPARSFVKQTKGHTGYSGCEKCTQPGIHEGRMYFPETDAPLRTNSSFNDMEDDEHHVGENPLRPIGIGMVTDIPLDYMHLVCLGVVKRILQLWMTSKANGPKELRIGSLAKWEISELLLALKHRWPKEFARKPRSLSELDRWKATEMRNFLLYSGPVVLQRFIKEEAYSNFMLLSVAIHVLANPSLCIEYNEYSHQLLVKFVKHFAQLYGSERVVYNVHSLIHLPEDVKVHGPLDQFSAFPFENYLGKLKNLVRKRSHLIQQVVLRLREASKFSRRKCQDSSILLKKKHGLGPVPDGEDMLASTQYEEVVLDKMVISIKQGDNCIKVDDKVGIVKNILEEPQRVCVVYSRFHSDEPFFSYPLDSRLIDVHKVSLLSNTLRVADISQVQGKFVLLPFQGKDVAIPLLHTTA